LDNSVSKMTGVQFLAERELVSYCMDTRDSVLEDKADRICSWQFTLIMCQG